MCVPLGQQPVSGQVAALVNMLVVVSELGLDGVGGEQHGRLRGAVDHVAQDQILHLQEEELLGHVLDQLVSHILRVELGPELEQQGGLLPHVLGRHLGGGGGRGEGAWRSVEEAEVINGVMPLYNDMGAYEI